MMSVTAQKQGPGQRGPGGGDLRGGWEELGGLNVRKQGSESIKCVLGGKGK